MSLNVDNRLGDSLYAALSAIIVPHPSDRDDNGDPVLVESHTLMTDAQILKVKEYIDIFVSEIVAEFVERAKVSIKMTEHTHTLTLVPVTGGGGGTVSGTTDVPNGATEVGDPEDTPSTGGIE